MLHLQAFPQGCKTLEQVHRTGTPNKYTGKFPNKFVTYILEFRLRLKRQPMHPTIAQISLARLLVRTEGGATNRQHMYINDRR